MLRFVSWFLNRETTYEPCKGCEMARYQLETANREKKELLDVILDLVRPKPVHVPETHVQVNNPVPRVGTWSRRRAALEESDRARASAMRGNNFMGSSMRRPASHENISDQEIDSVRRVEDEISKVERELDGNGGPEDASEIG